MLIVNVCIITLYSFVEISLIFSRCWAPVKEVTCEGGYLDRVLYFSYLTKTPFSLILQIGQLYVVLGTLSPLRSQVLIVPTNWLMIFSFSTTLPRIFKYFEFIEFFDDAKKNGLFNDFHSMLLSSLAKSEFLSFFYLFFIILKYVFNIFDAFVMLLQKSTT